MKKTAILCLAAALAMSINTSAQADWGRHRSDFRPPMPKHDHHYHRGGWIGPAAIMAIAGVAISTAAYSNAYAAPAPVYATPAYSAPTPVYVTPAPPASVWYYCASAEQYHPYTNACPEGWQVLPAH